MYSMSNEEVFSAMTHESAYTSRNLEGRVQELETQLDLLINAVVSGDTHQLQNYISNKKIEQARKDAIREEERRLRQESYITKD